jgi:hypothetical protein
MKYIVYNYDLDVLMCNTLLNWESAKALAGECDDNLILEVDFESIYDDEELLEVDME